MIDSKTLNLLMSIKEKLQQASSTVASAESCTGGIVATLLTYLPGSSQTFLGGVNAYANEVKSKLLGIEPSLIEKHGAVSDVVAKAMAAGIRAKIGSTYAVSLTGIAGPGGGVPNKPVGTVYCGFASPGGVTSFLWHLEGDRDTIRQKAALNALDILNQHL